MRFDQVNKSQRNRQTCCQSFPCTPYIFSKPVTVAIALITINTAIAQQKALRNYLTQAAGPCQSLAVTKTRFPVSVTVSYHMLHFSVPSALLTELISGVLSSRSRYNLVQKEHFSMVFLASFFLLQNRWNHNLRTLQ